MGEMASDQRTEMNLKSSIQVRDLIFIIFGWMHSSSHTSVHLSE